MLRTNYLSVLLLALLLLAGCPTTEDEGQSIETVEQAGEQLAAADSPEAEQEEPAPPRRKGPSFNAYPLSTCPVTGEELGSKDEPVVYDYNGREIRFCNPTCIEQFEVEPEKYIAEIDAAIVVQSLQDYPLETCLVDSSPLGETTIDHIYQNQLVRICCENCLLDFDEEPRVYMRKLMQARYPDMHRGGKGGPPPAEEGAKAEPEAAT